jgi:hypothetical protein
MGESGHEYGEQAKQQDLKTPFATDSCRINHG